MTEKRHDTGTGPDKGDQMSEEFDFTLRPRTVIARNSLVWAMREAGNGWVGYATVCRAWLAWMEYDRGWFWESPDRADDLDLLNGMGMFTTDRTIHVPIFTPGPGMRRNSTDTYAVSVMSRSARSHAFEEYLLGLEYPSIGEGA